MKKQQKILSKNLTEIFSLLQYHNGDRCLIFLAGKNVNALIPYFSLKA
jgi:hypothetical protein